MLIHGIAQSSAMISDVENTLALFYTVKAETKESEV
jgi:hypothetical protein